MEICSSDPVRPIKPAPVVFCKYSNYTVFRPSTACNYGYTVSNANANSYGGVASYNAKWYLISTYCLPLAGFQRRVLGGLAYPWKERDLKDKIVRRSCVGTICIYVYACIYVSTHVYAPFRNDKSKEIVYHLVREPVRKSSRRKRASIPDMLLWKVFWQTRGKSSFFVYVNSKLTL